MPKGWVDQFAIVAKRGGVEVNVVRRANGWPETVSAPTGQYFSKSATYRADRAAYFLGVDPKKLTERGAGVLVCGGSGSNLRDVFVIPWREFFRAVGAGEPVNTYRDRQYLQYKLHLRSRESSWLLVVQGAGGDPLDVTGWRHDPEGAIRELAAT